MLTPSTVSIWLTEQAVPLGIILAVLIGGYLLLKYSVARRKSTLVRERAGHTEDTFVEHLSAFGFDPALARSTYRYLQTEQNVHFPIFLTDHLDEDLGLDSEDIEQTRADLTSETGRELRPGIRPEPIVTVEDLIRFLQASPRRYQVAA